jgi:hypothetical protein
MAAAIGIRRLRNMSDLSFQNFLNDGGRAPRRGDSRPRQFLADLVQPGLHLGARAAGRPAAGAPRGQWSPRSSGSASARGPPRARQSGSPSNKTAPAPAAFPPSNSAASPCKTSPWGFPKAPLPRSPSHWRPAPGRRGPWRPSFPLQSPRTGEGPMRSRKKAAPVVAEAGRIRFNACSRQSRSTASSTAGRWRAASPRRLPGSTAINGRPAASPCFRKNSSR